MNVFSLLSQAARRWPDGIAVCEGERVVQTWSALEQAALALAARLRTTLGPASRIAIVSENRPACVQTLFGIWAAGMVAVPINYKLHPREVRAIVEDADAAALFASRDLADPLRPLLPAACRL